MTTKLQKPLKVGDLALHLDTGAYEMILLAMREALVTITHAETPVPLTSSVTADATPIQDAVRITTLLGDTLATAIILETLLALTAAQKLDALSAIAIETGGKMSAPEMKAAPIAADPTTRNASTRALGTTVMRKCIPPTSLLLENISGRSPKNKVAIHGLFSLATKPESIFIFLLSYISNFLRRHKHQILNLLTSSYCLWVFWSLYWSYLH